MPRRAALVNTQGVAEHVIIVPDDGSFTPPHGFVMVPHESVNIGDVHQGGVQFKRGVPDTTAEGGTPAELRGHAKGTYNNILREGFSTTIAASPTPVTITLTWDKRIRLLELAQNPPATSTTWVEDTWQADLTPAEVLDVIAQAHGFIANTDRNLKRVYDAINAGHAQSITHINGMLGYDPTSTDNYIRNINRFRT